MDKICIYCKNNMMDTERFAEFYRLIEISFPKCEHWSREIHCAEFSDPRFHSICYCPDGLKGFLNYWDLGGFIYVEHFAVAPELRGQGIGASLMAELRSIVGDATLVLEAEPSADSPIAARRIAFYERLGYSLNEYEYIQPAMMDDEPEVPLVIMSSPHSLSANEYCDVRDKLYREIYKKYD